MIGTQSVLALIAARGGSFNSIVSNRYCGPKSAAPWMTAITIRISEALMPPSTLAAVRIPAFFHDRPRRTNRSQMPTAKPPRNCCRAPA